MASQPALLLFTDAVALPAPAVLWTLAAFRDKADAGRRLGVLTRASHNIVGDLKLELSSLDAVVCWAENSGFLSVPWLVDLSKVLKPGGSLVVRQPETLDIQAKSTLERNLLLAGYINSQPLGEAEFFSQDVVMKAEKPTWEIGSSFAIQKATMKQEPSMKSDGATFKLFTHEINDIAMDGNSAGPSTAPGALKLPAFEADTDNDLVDEESLLTEEDLKRPALPPDDDCDVGKAGRKACKNCTCGRAALEGKERKVPTPEQLNNPQSACGNCGLGDGFRCGGCPYRGLPPFKLGEKIVLPGTLVTADV